MQLAGIVTKVHNQEFTWEVISWPWRTDDHVIGVFSFASNVTKHIFNNSIRIYIHFSYINGAYRKEEALCINCKGTTMELLLLHAANNNTSFPIIQNSFLNLQTDKKIKTVLVPESDIELQELLIKIYIKFQPLIDANLQWPNPQNK